MNNIQALSLVDLSRALAVGDLVATEVVDAYLDHIAHHNESLNAVVSLDEEGARTRAVAADKAWAEGKPVGPLHGVPLTLKDAHDVAGLRTTVGTADLDQVAEIDSTVAARLREAGANLIGHTNVPAWLADYQSANAIFGRTNNPWDLDRTSGGSSGGAAAAVAAELTPGDFGSDLSGSLRQPAAFCGVYSLKPTEHRVPLTGFLRTPGPRPVRVMACVGPIARSLDDLELLISIVVGPDGYDAEVSPVPFDHRPEVSPGALRLAVAPTLPGAPIAAVLSDTVREFAKGVSDGGGQVAEELPDLNWRGQLELFGDLLNTLTGSPENHGLNDYLTALHQRDILIATWDAFFQDHDALLMPAAATVAFPHSDGDSLDIDGQRVPYYQQGFLYALSSLTGLPAVTIPAGLDSAGLPVGLQLVGPRWSDTTLLAIARGLESSGIAPGYRRPPMLPA
ncbi:amidase family protein [Kribbella sp. NPDC003505]|uniref:amidase n=1 Tax=Kribbella sp. NPDC003505 TaxID=3154448 RepID=UPI0033BCAD76